MLMMRIRDADDQGGCSANEAASFAGISAAKRLCRIMRAVAAAAALPLYSFANGCCAAYTSSVGTSPTASPQGEAFWLAAFSNIYKLLYLPLIRFAALSTFPHSGGRLLWSCFYQSARPFCCIDAITKRLLLEERLRRRRW